MLTWTVGECIWVKMLIGEVSDPVVGWLDACISFCTEFCCSVAAASIKKVFAGLILPVLGFGCRGTSVTYMMH